MELFRISSEEFCKQLISSENSNRWNRRGEYVIYVGSTRSLLTFDLVVHRNFIKPDINHKVMVISVPDSDELVKTITTKELPSNWRRFEAYTDLQKIGSDWYNSKETLLLKVPSAVIPSEYNYIINTVHPNFKQHMKLVRIEEYFWDKRLITNE